MADLFPPCNCIIHAKEAQSAKKVGALSDSGQLRNSSQRVLPPTGADLRAAVEELHADDRLKSARKVNAWLEGCARADLHGTSKRRNPPAIDHARSSATLVNPSIADRANEIPPSPVILPSSPPYIRTIKRVNLGTSSAPRIKSTNVHQFLPQEKTLVCHWDGCGRKIEGAEQRHIVEMHIVCGHLGPPDVRHKHDIMPEADMEWDGGELGMGSSIIFWGRISDCDKLGTFRSAEHMNVLLRHR
ncbi:hypothetical protein GALMADRAFT_208941 [Galerina marginata CBS 339.88]|uniref:Uncharacterized protein n=1 Tax=Galerina marginata (strain CBS 339.88) TaxID=685588 RepID=A0A067TBB1_GALM3|nr:hypothetical protein GALMADRAFT_208941 [Galerina marginata CBS 339.88]